MRFIIGISIEEYTKFQKTNKNGNFVNSIEMFKLYCNLGYHTTIVGVKSGNNLVAATFLVQKRIGRVFNYLYAARGFLIDYNDEKLCDFFYTSLKIYIKNTNSIFLLVDPYINYKELDHNGILVDDGFNNHYLVDLYNKYRFKHQGFKKGYGQTEQYIRYMFVKNIESCSVDDIFNSFNLQTKRKINKLTTNQVKVRELKKDEINIFYDILNETSQRRDFVNRDISFYISFIDSFKGSAKMYLAYVNLNESISSNETELLSLFQTKENLIARIAINPSNKKNLAKLTLLDEQICLSEKRLEDSRNNLEIHGPILNLSASIFIFQGNEVTYFVGGSYNSHLKYNAQYAIQWHALKKALEYNMSIFNFYGISGNFEKDSSDHGVYKFKHGFGGNVRELVGDFVYIDKVIPFKILHYMQTIKILIKNIVNKISYNN